MASGLHEENIFHGVNVTIAGHRGKAAVDPALVLPEDLLVL
jgi:hypothetical protein